MVPGRGGRTPMTRRSADFEGMNLNYVPLRWSALECVRRDFKPNRIDFYYALDASTARVSGHREVTDTAARSTEPLGYMTTGVVRTRFNPRLGKAWFLPRARVVGRPRRHT